MKKTVKMLSVMLAAAMLFSLFAVPAVAHAESGTCGENVTWTLNDGVLTISGAGNMWEYEEYLDGVYTLWSDAPQSVIIEEGVTSVGARAFYGCADLKSVTFPASLKSIDAYAFSDCTGLTELTIPGGVREIAYEAFSGCSGLTSVAVPDNVEWLGDRVFFGCSGLISASIGSGLNSAGEGMFGDCPNLETITVSESNAKYSSINNCLIDTVNGNLLAGCKNSVIPTDAGLDYIGEDAFYGCTGLTSVEIPKGVTNIAQTAFSGCTGLTSASILDDSDIIMFIGAWAFQDCCNLKKITILNRNTNIGDEAFVSWKDEDGDGESEAYYPTTLRIYEGSRAHQYALANGIPYEFIGGSTAKGDPDGDGQITVADALSALRVAARLAESTDALIASCDIDGDGVITVADALSILRVAAKLADPSSLDGAEPVELLHIQVTTLPTKIRYIKGEPLDVSGGEVTLHYDNGSDKTVALTADMVSGFDGSTVGVYTLTVTYCGKMTTFNVTVVEDETVLRIAVTNLPKTAYKVGEELDVSGGAITVIYNGWSEWIPMTVDMVSGFDNSIVGTQVLTVSYGGVTTSYNVTVTDPAAKVTVSVETVEAAPGAKGVEVKIIVNAASKWNWVSMQLFFDPAGLIYKGYETNPVLNDEINAGEKINFYMDDTTAKNGTITTSLSSKKEEGNNYEYLFVMKFDIPSGASGFKHIVVDIAALKDLDKTNIPFTLVNGGVLVA